MNHTYASAYTGKVKISVKEGIIYFGKIKPAEFDKLSVYENEKVIKTLEPMFTVDASGKKVAFAPGNLYWDGSKFAFEAHQYDYPTTWDASHVGHFKWGSTAADAIKSDYSELTGNTFFAADGGVFEGFTVLSNDEWDYLLTKALAKNSSSQNTITIAGKSCIVLKPDGFSGTVADSYTAAEWATAEESGLVALPFASYRNGTDFYDAGSRGYYWSGTLHYNSELSVDYAHFYSSSAFRRYTSRRNGHSVRLVSVQ